MATCEYLVGRREIVGFDNHYLECVRPEDHAGPHLVKQPDGPYVAWEKDLCSPGECLDCDNEDPQDDCLCCWEITSAKEVQQYIDDVSFGNKK